VEKNFPETLVTSVIKKTAQSKQLPNLVTLANHATNNRRIILDSSSKLEENISVIKLYMQRIERIETCL
jgi:hypothetical protein